jgi:hypothetical protein
VTKARQQLDAAKAAHTDANQKVGLVMLLTQDKLQDVVKGSLCKNNMLGVAS